MKKVVLLAMLVFASSMMEASASTPVTESVSADFWNWLTSLFVDAGDASYIVKADGTIYDC
ncbi:MAG: hypothetical protein JSS23_04325 [Proteobacteria bacterium]|nr:hypothetical protein [Pseudomonadota bacterium]